MTKKPTLPPWSTLTHKEAPLHYPYSFRRVFLCGHPDEYIEVSRLLNYEHLTHTLITLEEYEQRARARKSRQMYTLERCRCCAFEYHHRYLESRRGSKKETGRSMAACQGEAKRFGQTVKRVKDGFELALKWMEKGNSAEHNNELHARVLQSEHDQDWQLLEGPDSSIYGRALRFAGRPGDSLRSSGDFGAPTSPLRITRKSLHALRGLDVLHVNNQRKDARFESREEHVNISDNELPLIENERPKTSGGRSSPEIMSHLLNEVKQCENDYGHQRVPLSRFSSSSSSSLHKTKAWWKLGKSRENIQQESKLPNPLPSSKGSLRFWRRHSKSGSVASEEIVQESSESLELSRHIIARSSTLGEGMAADLSCDDQCRSYTSSTVDGLGSKGSFLDFD
ncbi:Nn.00g093640.m01.CDS01 [Neocucurbitaria sp. VM-36]